MSSFDFSSGMRRLRFAAITMVAAVNVHAEAVFPSQPIKLVVPFAPGGGNDILARAIAPQMSKILGQPVIVDNRPGAGGNLGANIVAKATDGHTLLIASNQITINPAIGNKTQYDLIKDFTPIGTIASVPMILVVNRSSPYKTLPQFIEYARANPGKLTYSSPGPGTPQHLAGELFSFLSELQMLHVPYKGTSPAITDLVSGQVDASFATMASSLSFINGNLLKPLGVAGAKRVSALPDLPTISEVGVKDYDAELWYCMLAPASMPAANATKISAALNQTIKTLQSDDRIGKQGFQPVSSTRAELQEKISRDVNRWSRLVKESGLKVDMQ